MTRIKIVFLGPARDFAKTESLSLELPDGTTIADLRGVLSEQYPGLARALGTIRFAVNDEFADDETVLQADDEVVLIPPVSGGQDDGPAHVGPAHVGPTHVGPTHVGPTHVGPTHVGPAHVRETDMESTHVGRTNVGPTFQSVKEVEAADDQAILVELVAGPIPVERVRDFVTGDPTLGGIATFEGATRREVDDEHGRLVRLDYEAYEPMARQELQRLAVEAKKRWSTGRVAIIHRLGSVPPADVSVMIAVACGHRAESFEACRWLIDTLKRDVPIWKKNVFEDGHVSWVKPTEPV